MKRIILTAQEARSVAAGMLTEVRRKVRPLFAKGGLPQREGPCPFGVPGGLLWCAEWWRFWEEDCGGDHEGMLCGAHCRQVYVAYEATPRCGYRPVPDKATITYLHESTPVTDDSRLCGPWRQAVTMPRWASRFALRHISFDLQKICDAWTWIGTFERAEGAP